MAANIAWAKFDNPVVREVLEKHIGKNMPCANVVAGKLDQHYEEVMEVIKKDLQGKPFWLSTDETTGMYSILHAFCLSLNFLYLSSNDSPSCAFYFNP